MDVTCVATSPDRVRVVFAEPIERTGITAVGAYRVRDLRGPVLTIDSVVEEQGTALVRSVVLILLDRMRDEQHYEVRIALAALASVKTCLVQCVVSPLRVQIPLSVFSGQVDNGMLGTNPNVFMSPAFETPVSGSLILVEEVEVCTRADDVYEIPPTPLENPTLFTTYANPGAPRLNTHGVVLWAPTHSYGEGSADLSSRFTETVPHPVAEIVYGMLTTTWDPQYVGLLNNPGWTLNTAAAGKRVFITADNLTAIPAGETQPVFGYEVPQEFLTTNGAVVTKDGEPITVRLA